MRAEVHTVPTYVRPDPIMRHPQSNFRRTASSPPHVVLNRSFMVFSSPHHHKVISAGLHRARQRNGCCLASPSSRAQCVSVPNCRHRSHCLSLRRYTTIESMHFFKLLAQAQSSNFRTHTHTHSLTHSHTHTHEHTNAQALNGMFSGGSTLETRIVCTSQCTSLHTALEKTHAQ